MLKSDTTALMQQTSPRMSNWVSLQQADAQTATNETESKSQTLLLSIDINRNTSIAFIDIKFTYGTWIK